MSLIGSISNFLLTNDLIMIIQVLWVCLFLASIAVMSVDLGSEWLKVAIVKVMLVFNIVVNFYI